MRVVALLAAHNEERMVAPCIRHLARHGIETYLIDNGSTDQTVAIARAYYGRGLAGIEHMPRDAVFALRPQLNRKEALAAELGADWFLHVDADEIRLPPSTGITLMEAFAEVDALGYNAVNFQEFTFVPTKEAPDHDHPRFQETMRHYYPFLPVFPHRLNAWKSQEGPVDLARSGGHRVDFPGLRMYPESFPMRHYLYLSVQHAIRKYVERSFAPEEVAAGWHGGRASLDPTTITLLSQARLREYVSDDELDPSDPWASHPLFAATT